MAKQWKKLQRADSAFTGDVTGTINGATAADIKSGASLGTSSNQDSTSSIRDGVTKTHVGLGSVDNITTTAMRAGVSKSDVGLNLVANESRATILGGTFTGNVTGNIDGESASSIKTKATMGRDAKDAVDGNAAVTMVGGSINIGSGEWTVDSSGNQITKGTITINKDSGGSAGLTLNSGSSGDMTLLMEGANPDVNIGGASPLGTGLVRIKRGGTGNGCNLFFYTGGTAVKAGMGFTNQPTAYNSQFAIHAGGIYDSSSPYFERDFTIDADHRIGFWANDKTGGNGFAGVTIGSDGTNKGLYVKDHVCIGDNNPQDFALRVRGEVFLEAGGGDFFLRTDFDSQDGEFQVSSRNVVLGDFDGVEGECFFQIDDGNARFNFENGTAYFSDAVNWSGGGSTESNAAYDAMGWHGSPTKIKIIPSDFMTNDDSTTYNVAVVDNGGKIKAMTSSLEAYAMYPIPTGFKATYLKVYGNDSANYIYVYEGYISNSSANSRGSGKINQSINMTDVTSSTTNYLIIKWVPTATSDYLYGGYIDIARV